MPMQPKAPRTEELTSPLKAIRAYCIECCCGSAYEVSLCPATECELHGFRFGKNPYKKTRELTEEQKAELVSRFSKQSEKSP